MRYDIIEGKIDPSTFIPKELARYKIRPSRFDEMLRLLTQMMENSRMWTLQKWMVAFIDEEENLNFVTPADSLNTIIRGNQRAFTGIYPALIFIGDSHGQPKMIRVLWDPNDCKY